MCWPAVRRTGGTHLGNRSRFKIRPGRLAIYSGRSGAGWQDTGLKYTRHPDERQDLPPGSGLSQRDPDVRQDDGINSDRFALQQAFHRPAELHLGADLENPVGPQTGLAVGGRQHLGEQCLVGFAEDLRSPLDPAAKRCGCEKIGSEAHRRHEPVGKARLHPRRKRQLHVGKQRQHSAVTDAHRVAMPLLDAKAKQQVPVHNATIKRAIHPDKAGLEGQFDESIRNLRSHMQPIAGAARHGTVI